VEARPDAAFVWKSSGESFVIAHDGEDCEERLNGDDWARGDQGEQQERTGDSGLTRTR